MKHVLTNTPMFHSDSEKLRRKFLTTKSFSSDQTCHIEKKKKFDIVYDMTFICPQLDFGIHVIGSTPLLLLHYLIEKTGDSTHRRTCHWGRGAATPPSPRPSKFWATQIFGAARETWGNQIFTKFPCFVSSFFFLERVIFLFRALVGVVKPVKFISGLCVESNSEQHSQSVLISSGEDGRRHFHSQKCRHDHSDPTPVSQ